MSVPNTNTFSLQDVQQELGGVNDDLIECFGSSISSGFDPLYSGSKNQLLNFRNYNNISGGTDNIFTIESGIAVDTPQLACSAPNNAITTLYYGEFITSVVVSVVIFIDNPISTVFPGNNKWYAGRGDFSMFVYQINNSGVIIDIFDCSLQ